MKNLRFALSVSIVALMATGAHAQTSGPVLDEIIVTSQKREQNILDVPISLSAIGGEQLEERGFTEIGDLQFVTPGLQFTQANTTRISNISLRGIGTSTFSDSIEGSVGIVVDGVVIGRAGGGLFDLADIERVEVLRGPQGTLFGKNASAGVLNIITKRPSTELDYNAVASYASQNEVKLSGSISGPINENIGVRITGYRNSRDGQIENLATGDDLNNRDEFGIRGKLQFGLSDNTELLIIGDYSERDTLCCAWTTRSFSPGGLGTGLFGSGFNVLAASFAPLGITPGPENEQTAATGSFESVGKTKGISAELNHSFGNIDFTSITAYREWRQRDNNDADQTPLNLLDLNIGDAQQDQFTQEIRLSSTYADVLDWTIGAYYFNQSVVTDSTQAGTYGLSLPGFPFAGTNTIFDRSLSISPKTDNYAVFADFSLALSDRLNVLAGIRGQVEEITASFVRTNQNPLTQFVLGPAFAPLTDELSVDDEAITWRLGVQYNLSEESNIYATVTQGYKGPGINTNVDTTQLRPVEPEIPLSFELGSKSQLFGGRARFNAAAYYTTFENFQAEALTRSAAGTFFFDVVNAGELEVYGVEADLSAQLTENWNVTGGVTLSSSTYKEFDNGDCFEGQTVAQGCIGGVQDLAGADLPNSPDFTFNVTSTYEFPLTEQFNGFVSGSYYYRDSTISQQDQDPNTRLKAYGLLDGSIGVRSDDNRWGVSLFGKNLLGEDFVEAIFDTPFDTGGYSQFLTPASETVVGIRLDFQK